MGLVNAHPVPLMFFFQDKSKRYGHENLDVYCFASVVIYIRLCLPYMAGGQRLYGYVNFTMTLCDHHNITACSCCHL